MQTLTFDYRPRARSGLFLILISAPFAIGGTWLALENNQSIEILGMNLSVSHSTGFFWLTALGFGSGIPLGIAMIRQSLAKPRQVLLTDTEITGPRHQFRKEMRSIVYRGITKMRVWTMKSTTMLEIKDNKQTFAIPKVCIGKPGEFNALCKNLEKRIVASRLSG